MMEPKLGMESGATASDDDITDVMRKVEVIRRRMATVDDDEAERRRRRRRAEADALIARLGEDKVSAVLTRGVHLFRRFCKMFCESSQAVGPYFSCHVAQESKKHTTKPSEQVAASSGSEWTNHQFWYNSNHDSSCQN